MVETPVFDPVERSLIAHQLQNVRRSEQDEHPDAYNRGKEEYIEYFQGLAAFFSYIKTVSTIPTVLDIGSGTTRGVIEFAANPITDGLTFVATSLRSRPEIGRFHGYERTRITSAERLRGIPDTSIAGILALNSISYSAAPEQTIRSIDRVLVPGGALKATFRSRKRLTVDGETNELDRFLARHIRFREERHDAMGLQYHNAFTAELHALGYDIALSEDSQPQIVLAIKQGGQILISAQDILEQDRNDFKLEPEATRLNFDKDAFLKELEEYEPTDEEREMSRRRVAYINKLEAEFKEWEKINYPDDSFSFRRT